MTFNEKLKIAAQKMKDLKKCKRFSITRTQLLYNKKENIVIIGFQWETVCKIENYIYLINDEYCRLLVSGEYGDYAEKRIRIIPYEIIHHSLKYKMIDMLFKKGEWKIKNSYSKFIFLDNTPYKFGIRKHFENENWFLKE